MNKTLPSMLCIDMILEIKRIIRWYSDDNWMDVGDALCLLISKYNKILKRLTKND